MQVETHPRATKSFSTTKSRPIPTQLETNPTQIHNLTTVMSIQTLERGGINPQYHTKLVYKVPSNL
jgi:hypothetical protein